MRYYRRVVDACGIEVAFSHTVTAIARDGGAADGPFTVATVDGDGRAARWTGRSVLVATGTYDHPNRLGVPGEDLPHVSHYYAEPHPFYRKSVVIVGGKNSAAEAALDLFRNGVQVTLVHRRAELGASIKYWVKPISRIASRRAQSRRTSRRGSSKSDPPGWSWSRPASRLARGPPPAVAACCPPTRCSC